MGGEIGREVCRFDAGWTKQGQTEPQNGASGVIGDNMGRVIQLTNLLSLLSPFSLTYSLTFCFAFVLFIIALVCLSKVAWLMVVGWDQREMSVVEK